MSVASWRSTDSNSKGEISMTIYRPYTYRISWTSHNKSYYGVRFAKNCSPDDFWKTYFTSSALVKEFRLTHGEPDVIEIRRTFKTGKEALKWERNVLKRLKVNEREDWLNIRASGSSIMNDDIAQRIKLIEKLRLEVETHLDDRLNQVRARIEKNIADLITEEQTDKNRMEQEIIYYLEKR